MKTHLLKLTAIALAGILALPAAAQDKPQSFVVELSSPGKPATLSIDSRFERITVTAEDRADMAFAIGTGGDDEARGQGRWFNYKNEYNYNYNYNYNDGGNDQRRPQRDNSNLTRIDSNTGFVVEELNNHVKFETEFNRPGLHVQVRVPRQTSLKLDCVNGGPITVSGASGTHELSNTNGSIYAADLSGSVVAETTNGSIEVSLREVTPDTPMAFSTTNGSIDVTFPASYRATAVIDPGRGATYTDFEFKVDNAPARVETRAGERGKRIEVKREVRGTINGGGPSLRMETINGSIYIRKGK
jgi:hypothetical protein